MKYVELLERIGRHLSAAELEAAANIQLATILTGG
jgi:hypothetical protein